MAQVTAVVLALLALLLHPAAAGVNYALSLPSQFRTSSSPRVFYFLSGLEEVPSPSTLAFTLADASGKALLTSEVSIATGADGKASGSSILELSSSFPPGSYLFIAELRGSSTTIFQNQTTIEVVAGRGMLLAETDRPIYKPGQVVKIRALSFDQNLLPQTSAISFEILDPKGFKVGRFENVTDAYGYSEAELPLSAEPNLGNWTISVFTETSGTQVTFRVDRYVLPTFDVVLSFEPGYITTGMDSIQGSLQATYSYGKPVQGTANITLYRKGYFPPTMPTLVIQEPTAAAPSIAQPEPSPASNSIPGRRGMDQRDLPEGPESPSPSKDPLPDLAPEPTSVPSEASDPEEQEPTDAPEGDRPSGAVELLPGEEDYRPPQDFVSEVVESKLVNLAGRGGATPFSFTGLIDKISSGGQFSVHATVWEAETGVSGSTSAELPFVWTRINYEISEVLFKPDLPLSFVLKTFSGLNPVDRSVDLVFVFTLGSDAANQTLIPKTVQTQNGAQQVEIQVPEGTTSICLNIEDLLCAKTFTMSNSRLGMYLSVSPPFSSQGSFSAGDELTFQISSTDSFAPAPAFPVIYHVVSPRGVILSGMISDGTELKIQATTSMAPEARLIVTALRDGEILADFTDFQVSSLLATEVLVEFDPAGGVSPGSEIEIEITSEGLSRVGVVVVDKSVTILAGSSTLQAGQVKDYLTSRSVLSPVSPTYSWGSRSIGAGDIFASSGLRVLSNLHAQTSDQWVDIPVPQGEAPPAVPQESPGLPSSPSEASPVRSFFPETWLWSTAITDSSGKASIQSKVPDSITSWSLYSFSISKEKGLGIGPTRELSVTKPFFISLDLPYSATLGEVLPVKVVLYNYASSSLTLSVSLSSPDTPSPSQFSFDNIFGGDSRGFEVVSGPASSQVTVEPQGLGQLVYSIRPKAIGSLSLLVKASSPAFSDTVLRSLPVEAPGIREVQLETQMVTQQTEQEKTKVTFQMDPPDDTIDGSAKGFLSLTGDILGSSMNNLEGLLSMPTGCGEQNMVGFAPDVFITRYLNKTQQLKPEIQQLALRMMTTGYQRELTFVHPDGSFSAFGDQDDEGSMWLTAFVLKSFAQARPFIYIDPAILGNASAWITSHQREDGSFNQVGQVIHTSDLMGGEKGDLGHSAFVTVALLEYDPSLEGTSKAVAYLESKLGLAKGDSFTAAIVTYALVLANSPSAPEMLSFLKSTLIYSDGQTMAYWSSRNSVADKTIGRPCLYCPDAPKSVDIETTSYGLLALSSSVAAMDDETIELGLKISRWLVQQRNPSGGFLSTQDTCVGLQALTTYVALTFSGGDHLTISLRSSSDLGFSEDVVIDSENFDLLQTVEVPTKGRLLVQIQGKGTVVLQKELRYNHLVTGADQNNFDLSTNWTAINDDLAQTTACFTSNVPNQPGMVLLEVGLLTGYQPIQQNLDEVLEKHTEIKRIDLQETKIILYLSGVESGREYCYTLQTIRIYITQRLQNSLVSVFSYYSPELRASKALRAPPTNLPEGGKGEEQPTKEEGGGGEGEGEGGEKGGNSQRALGAALGVCLGIVAVAAAVLAFGYWRRRSLGRRIRLRGSFEDIPLDDVRQ